ncbi:MAG: multidrug effflux MFS transporter [Pseudomonadota bacterium]
MKEKIANNSLFPWLLVLYEVVIYLSMDAYMPAFPMIARTFGISANITQLTATVWILGGLAVQLIFGPLSDRYGRRPILLFSGVLYVFSTILCAFATGIHIFLIARFFQGMAMPAMFIAGYAAINEYFDSKEAIRILALMQSVTILAPAVGPMLGGAMLLFVNWRWIFILLAIWSCLMVIALFFNMPETLPVQKRTNRIHLGEIIKQYKTVLFNLTFIMYALTMFLPIIGLVAWILVGPFLVVDHFHYSTLDYGMIQAFIFASYILGTKLVRKYASDHRNHLLINLGLSCSFIGVIAAVLIAYLLPNGLFYLIGSIMMILLGSGIAMPILNRLTLETSDAPMGVRVTIFSVIRMGSGFLGTICVPLFYNGTLLSTALIMFVFILIAVVLRIFTLCFA